MISAHVRRIALSVLQERGGSLQDILQEMVSAASGGHVPFHSHMICLFCGSTRVLMIASKPGSEIKIRNHRCDFCGATFLSEEILTKNKLSLEESAPPVVKEKKKRHIKKRGG